MMSFLAIVAFLLLAFLILLLGWTMGYSDGKRVGITVGRSQAWRSARESYQTRQDSIFLGINQQNALATVTPIRKDVE